MRRTCRDVAVEMRKKGRELLALGEINLGTGGDDDGDSNSSGAGDGDSSSGWSEEEEELDGVEELWFDTYCRVQCLGGMQIRVGLRQMQVRELLEGSCGTYDIGENNFRLLTNKNRSKFATPTNQQPSSSSQQSPSQSVTRHNLDYGPYRPARKRTPQNTIDRYFTSVAATSLTTLPATSLQH